MNRSVTYLIALLVAGSVNGVAAAQTVTQDETDLTLLGTVAASDSSGLAIIQRANGTIQFVKRGGEVKGYTVTAVISAGAILRKMEEQRTIELSSGRPGSTGPARAADLAQRRQRVSTDIEERRSAYGAEPLQGRCGEIRFFYPDGTEVSNSRLILTDDLSETAFAPPTDQDWPCPSPWR